MPSKVLLISANRCTAPDPVFPLGLAHINAALRAGGYETLWLDRLVNLDQFGETLATYQPDFIGISLRNIDDVLIRKQERFFDELSSLGQSLRRHSTAPIILGGSGFSIFPKRLLELAGADYGISGEGEDAFPQLLDALRTGADYREIPGLVYRHEGRVVANPAAVDESAHALSEADRPEQIRGHYVAASGILNVQTQRGCRFRCCYCTYPLIEGNQHRRRPPERVAEEFVQLQRQGARYAFIVDSVFNSSPRHVSQICEELLRRNIKLPWGCFLRPQGLTPELMDLMARAGLTHIEFGSDSLSDTTLAAYHKDFSFDDIQRSSELARQRKIEYCHFLIAGGPGETMATLREGFENSLRLSGAVMMAVVGMRIYPGTHLYDQAIAESRFGRDTDLLAPTYYLASGLTEAGVFAQLQEFSRRSPNWIVGDPVPEYTNLIQRLRKRGATGPLWSYFSTVQRLWQPGRKPDPHMKRLLLISPLARNSLLGGALFFRMPCLGLLKVAALTPAEWQVSIVDEKIEALDLNQEADLVGITAMTTTVQRAYEIADHFRARGVRVVMEGMHVSCLPEEALRHCDSVVVGEAEGLWPGLLNDFNAGKLQPIYRHEQGLPPLVQMPLPDWELYRSKNYLSVHYVETTRGCPIDCEFCAVTSAFGGRYRNRPQEEVLAELKSLRPFESLLTLKNCVFFVDDNIISNRAYAREFLSRIADFKLHWFGQASMNIANEPEILKLCQRSGCVGLFLGFETLSSEALKAVGKRVNKPDQYYDVVRKIHDHGIGIDGSFVFGFDTDDAGVFDRTLEFVIKAKLEVAYFSILTPYPGTRLHQRLVKEGRMLSNDWSLYDANHVVFRPKTFTPDQLLAGYYGALKEVYSLSSIFQRLWGTSAWKNFFYPMNFGFRQSVGQLARKVGF